MVFHNHIPLHFQHLLCAIFPTSFSRALAHPLWLFCKMPLSSVLAKFLGRITCENYWGRVVLSMLCVIFNNLQERKKQLNLFGALICYKFSSCDYYPNKNYLSQNLKIELVMWKLWYDCEERGSNFFFFLIMVFFRIENLLFVDDDPS